MAKMFTCPECGEEIVADMQSRLVDMVREHAQAQHDLDLDEEDIREGIEDT